MKHMTHIKIMIAIMVVAMISSFAVPAFAQTAIVTPTSRQTKKELLQTVKSNNRSTFGHLAGAAVTALTASGFTVSADGKTVTVVTDTGTKFRRHYWGNSSISEISVNDTVNMWGDWSNDSQTAMTALLVRDLSIMKRTGVFFGTITSTNTNGFVMSTINRGNQTVTVSSSTKYLDRKGQTIPFSTIVTGNKVRVRGMWDKVNSTITEVSEVKDFTLPATTSPTLTPTAE